MKKQSFQNNILLIFLGALLMGMLWRVRGTGGWGSSWGLLNAGVVFLLFLNTAVNKKTYNSLTLIALSGLSFMLTCPAWGTYLNQITGILSVSPNEEQVIQYEINPLSGVIMMLLLGFGLASVYGIMIGRCFGEHQWRIRDYLFVAVVFIVVDLAAKATVSHLTLKLIEPQAVTAFTDGLKAEGIAKSVYASYMSHFSAVSWAKKLIGGRNYFSSVGTISLVYAGIASLLAARFYVKDRYAARVGTVVCFAFAFSITISDLFFYFGNGGYHMEQGLTLPSSFAPWSLWEYFTGFLAGGIITAFVIYTHPEQENKETALDQLPLKFKKALSFIFAVVPGIGLNCVRPLLERIRDKTVGIIVTVVVSLMIFAATYLFASKRAFALSVSDLRRIEPAICLFFVVYMFIVYMFIGKPEISGIGMLHNILLTISAASVSVYLAYRIHQNRTITIQ